MNAILESPAPPTAPSSAPRREANPTHGFRIVAALLLALGIFLRIYPSAGFTGVGFDEALYRDYLLKVDKVGLFNYPEICQFYIADQRKPGAMTKLPPTRFLYVACGWMWKRVQFGDAEATATRSPDIAQRDPALLSLHRVSCLFSILFLGLTAVWGARMFGRNGTTLGLMALMSVAPLQIHMGQHALIDGFFAFWAMLALWTFWECLRHPNHRGWLTAHGASIALMVLAKENAFFVYVALGGLLIANRWLRVGVVTPKLLAAMVAGPAVGVAVLLTLAGGPGQAIEIYRLLVQKAQTLTYAIKTGDGPWHRYLIDILIVSPIVLCLALTALPAALKERRACAFLAVFTGVSYAVMCNVKYGMNLRYATIWDIPLRALAMFQITQISRWFGPRQVLALAVLVAFVCAFELRQYVVFFKDFGLYELVTEGLLNAVNILKTSR
jgi:hypothetical protein